ncbi:hypothetical protein LEL_05577 [Akanthomyces lecanii RCEF 1005]|uniref:Uncharacterized protein n=1 Tax=Akanthomyces lecanii RCEF 1005 TaxID=1081108 RepID=A0A168G1H1_CORDF|nr:hypothetical protein LEL_05577 [Akanthomyces lecanii RCEF 1005]
MPASLESSRPIMAPSQYHPNPATSLYTHDPLSLFLLPTVLDLPPSTAFTHIPPLAANMMVSTKARTSVRYSTYSVAPSVTPTFATNESAQAEFRDIAFGLDRMENKALSSQRVVLDEEKTDNMRKLALGAKLERALDRRMSSQDAVMRPRPKKPVMSEKQQLVEKVA